jgi:hypothetical protein
VGIIANPAAGSDIRRLVALGEVSGALEKANTVQRLLIGLGAAGAEHIYLMPDAFRIARTALARLPERAAAVRERASVLDLPVRNRPEDSLQAAVRMAELGVQCIVVLGGDGTNRVVAKGCGQVPIVPLSTGTNNVIPYRIDGTLAGLAAGFLARHPEGIDRVAYRSKVLQACIADRSPDIALVDVSVVRGRAVGSRAVWDPSALQQVVLTRSEPHATGMSALGAPFARLGPRTPRGMSLWLGCPAECEVQVPLAPGLMATVGIERHCELDIGDAVTVNGGGVILALDGERELALREGESAEIRLRADGPWIVDVFRALEEASAQQVSVRMRDRACPPAET